MTDASLGLIQHGAWRRWVIIRASDEASRSFAITEKAPTRLNVKVISREVLMGVGDRVASHSFPECGFEDLK